MPLFQDISTPDFDRIREVLHRLSANPPQVLLLEGGTGPQRLAAARYWAACVNCPQPGSGAGPASSAPPACRSTPVSIWTCWPTTAASAMPMTRPTPAPSAP